MMPGLGLSILVSIAVGVGLIRWIWPGAVAAWWWPLGTALGVSFGLGLSSVLLYLWMLAFGPTRGFPLAECFLLAFATAIVLVRNRGGPKLLTAPAQRDHPGSPAGLSAAAAGLALAAAGAAFLGILRRQPHGEWDAWMNWDLRARMIFRGGEAWRAAFSDMIPWSHPDYPLMVQSLVVRSWLYAGGETLGGPALVAAAFTFGTVALLVAALAALRSANQGLLAGLVLLSTPFFIVHGASFYGDVPIGLFLLATFVCLALDGRYGEATRRFAVLAGAAAGFAMWTKNEGVTFVPAIGTGLLVSGLFSGWPAARRRLTGFGLGVMPMVLVAASFKLRLAPRNDLLATLGIERTIDWLIDPRRYYHTLREFITHLGTFGYNGVGSATWLLLAYLLAMGIGRREIDRVWMRTAAVVLVLMLAVDYVVFVAMAYDLPRLLNSSLDRLLLQLWPSALFLLFMAVRTPEEAGLPLRRAKPS
jgi:dolichyl-phosphate-mannose-protein mannosyltransferase